MEDVVLVQDIVKTLVKIFQVEENDSQSSFHADLNLIDVTTNLGSMNWRTYASQIMYDCMFLNADRFHIELKQVLLWTHLSVFFIFWETTAKENEWIRDAVSAATVNRPFFSLSKINAPTQIIPRVF